MPHLTLFLFVLLRVTMIVCAGFVPPAEFCLPSAHLKELSGCIAMTNKEDECGAKETQEDKLDCYCTQDTLSSIYA
jgi:hypothetical protein